MPVAAAAAVVGSGTGLAPAGGGTQFMCNRGTILRGFLTMWLAAEAAAQVPVASVRGVVLDASGAPVPGALVVVESPAGTQVVRTDAAGRFAVELPEFGACVLRARAEGFAEAVISVAPRTGEVAESRLVLQPAGISETVTVTASAGVEPLTTPASLSVLAAGRVMTTAAPLIDDALRLTPGFSLFRRSSSRVANPSAQGVTLRGVSGSGASRTLVVADGLPLNDAFGSWVYWNRIPIAAIDRVAVLRGATGDLYGADALGGVIQLFTFSPFRPRFRAIVEAGSHETLRGSLFAAAPAARITLTAAGEWLTTSGVHVVAAKERGPVDVPTGSNYRTGLAELGVQGRGWRGRGRVHTFQEVRSNGTALVGNDTNWRQWMGEAAGPLGGGSVVARMAQARQRYFNNFAAVASDRASERLTRSQRIPSTAFVASGEWVRPWARGTLIAQGHGAQMALLSMGQRRLSLVTAKRVAPVGPEARKTLLLPERRAPA